MNKAKHFIARIVALSAVFVGGIAVLNANPVSAKTHHAKTHKHYNVRKHTFKVGETATYEGVEMKVNSVTYTDHIGDSTPDDGKQYVIVSMTLDNKTKKHADYNDVNFKFDNNGDAQDAETVSEDSNEMNDGTLDPHAKITKDVIGQVPTNVDKSKLKLVYQPMFFDDEVTVHFSLNQQ